MAYLDYEYYKKLYGSDAVDETVFNRLLWDCEKRVDNLTTCADGVRKLRVAYPAAEYDSECVKRCVGKLIEIAKGIEDAQKRVTSAQGYVQREDGSLQGKVVTSVSAGNESVSYSAGSNLNSTLIDKALSDQKVQDRLYNDTIIQFLSGVPDANGVNLLFAGPYPARLRGTR